MLKINELLDKTSKVVASVAGITFGTAIICRSLVSIKKSVSFLKGAKKVVKIIEEVSKKEPKDEALNTDSKPSEEK